MIYDLVQNRAEFDFYSIMSTPRLPPDFKRRSFLRAAFSGALVTPGVMNAAEVEKAGAEYTGADLEIDGKLITANGPVPAKKYGAALVEALK